MSIEFVEIGASNLKIADGNYSAKYPRSEEFASEGVPFIRANNFHNKTISDEDMYFISEEKHAELKKGHVKPRDVLITTRGNIGQVAIVPERHDDSNINAQIVLLRCNEGWYPEYLLHAFTSDFVSKQIPSLTTGTALKQLPVKNLKKLKIPLPPLDQQKQIAKILDTADAYRQKTKALIDKYDALTQSLFLDMFGDPVTNPKGWDKKPMGDLMTIVRGGSPRPIKNFIGGNNPWIKIGDATKGDDIYLNSTKEHITDAGLSKTRVLPEGSLIFANCGVSLGFARIIKFEGCIHDGWLAFSDFDENMIDKIFLLKSLNSVTKYFRDTAPDGTQPNLNTSIMKKYEIILPPIDMQRKFVNSLNSIYEQKALAQQELDKADQLFNSLLQKAFKGELV